MKKAVAIPYVIALILGVIAIGVLAYWLINQAGKTTDTGSTAECQARAFNFCLAWQNKDPTCDTGRPDNLVGCSTPDEIKCKEIGFCK